MRYSISVFRITSSSLPDISHICPPGVIAICKDYAAIINNRCIQGLTHGLVLLMPVGSADHGSGDGARIWWRMSRFPAGWSFVATHCVTKHRSGKPFSHCNSFHWTILCNAWSVLDINYWLHLYVRHNFELVSRSAWLEDQYQVIYRETKWTSVHNCSPNFTLCIYCTPIGVNTRTRSSRPNYWG